MKILLIAAGIILCLMGVRVPDIIEQFDTQPVFLEEREPFSSVSREEFVKNPIKPKSPTVTITAVGDCTLATDVNYANSGSFENVLVRQNGDFSYFFLNVADYFESDDITIVNFEGTLSERGSRQDKEFAFRGEPSYVEILTSSSVEAANLANNHTKDYGMEAFEDTDRILTENNIHTFGGMDVELIEKNGIKVGLVGIYALNYAQQNLMDSAIEKVKKLGPDIIVVSFHWGIERDIMPNTQQISLAHRAVDRGADLVVGHHPHVLQGIEKYKGKYILYSLGNFCFGGSVNPSDKDTMIFQQTFTLEDGELVTDDNIFVIPCSISSQKDRNNYQPTPLSGVEYERVKEKIKERSGMISDAEIKFSDGNI